MRWLEVIALLLASPGVVEIIRGAFDHLHQREGPPISELPPDQRQKELLGAVVKSIDEKVANGGGQAAAQHEPEKSRRR